MTNDRREELPRLVEEARRAYLEELELGRREFEALAESARQEIEATLERIGRQAKEALSIHDERQARARARFEAIRAEIDGQMDGEDG